MIKLVFFFSSRRRHTRWTGDWSSDVCSSDLGTRETFSPGTKLPTYSLARHVVPGLKVTRVPERLLPLACLALAALLAVALTEARPWLVALVLVLVAADLHVSRYHATRADQGNAAYAAVRHARPGRLLE